MKFILVALLAVVVAVEAKKFHADKSFSVSSSIKHYAGNYRPGQKVDCYAKMDDSQVASGQSQVIENDARGYLHIGFYPLNGLLKYQAKISHHDKFPSGQPQHFTLYRGVRGVEEDSLQIDGGGQLVDFTNEQSGLTEKVGQFWLKDPQDAQRLLNNGLFAAVDVLDEQQNSVFAIRGQVICQAQDHAEVSSSLKSVDTD